MSVPEDGRPVMVLFSGKKGAGKDYIAEQLVEAFHPSHSARLMHFADPVKKMYCAETGADYVKLTSKDTESRAYKESHRMSLAAFWTRNRVTAKWIVDDILASFRDNVGVMADWRQPNELTELQRGGMLTLTVRIDISDVARAKRGWVPSERDSHYTEVGLDNHVFDLRYANDTDGIDGIHGFIHDTVLPAVHALRSQPPPDVMSAKAVWCFSDPTSVWRPSASYTLHPTNGTYEYHYVTDTDLPNTRDESFHEKGTWWVGSDGCVVLKCASHNGAVRSLPGFRFDSKSFVDEKSNTFTRR